MIIVKKCIKWILITLIPIIFEYLAQSKRVFVFFIEKGIFNKDIDIEQIQDMCLIISIVSTVVVLTINLIRVDIQMDSVAERREKVCSYLKEVLIASLRDFFGNQYLTVDVRIFVPRKYRWWKIRKLFNKNAELIFVCKNERALAREGIKSDLSFVVYPKPQGLVGNCYKSRQAQYDDNLKENNSIKYGLDDNQIEKTNDLNFSLVYPIYNKNNDSGKSIISAIIAIDCESPLKVEDDKVSNLANRVGGFAKYLHELVPEVFSERRLR